jgi:hypothetical protein
MAKSKKSLPPQPALLSRKDHTEPPPSPSVPAEDTFPVYSDPPPPPATVTKTEMIKRALAAGQNKPTAGVQWIKDNFGEVISTNLFSTTRYQLSKKGKPKAVKAAPQATGYNHRPTSPSNPAELARSVKTLVDSFGVEAVSDMLSVFAD